MTQKENNSLMQSEFMLKIKPNDTYLVCSDWSPTMAITNHTSSLIKPWLRAIMVEGLILFLLTV